MTVDTNTGGLRRGLPPPSPCAWLDVHAHLVDPRFPEGAEAVVRHACQAGVGWMLSATASEADWAGTVSLACATSAVSAALGVHPWFAGEWCDGLRDVLTHRVEHTPEIVAIGEIGLDFWHGRADMARQIRCFSEQLAIARQFNLPVVLHNRKSWNECFARLRHEGLPTCGGICHGFAASVEIARQALDLGLYLSFGGPLADPRHRRCRAAAGYAPADRLLVESDAPDMPTPRHAGELSRPEHVVEVYETLAELRSTSVVAVRRQVADNARRLFGG